MPALRTVLCPVDLSELSVRQTAIAAEICRAFGARLVLHHNLRGATAAGVGWMWAAEHGGVVSEQQAEDRLRALQDTLAAGVEHEARLTHGPSTQAVLAVGEAVAADLIVLSTHGATDDGHTSVSEAILDHSNRALLVLHEPAVDREVPHFGAVTAEPQRVLVPVDLGPGSRSALAFAFDLARLMSVELHLLHVVEKGGTAAGGTTTALEALRREVPEALQSRVEFPVETGEPAIAISDAARRLAVACIVMGEHSHRTLRSWFRHDHARDVLHHAPCPVWYVPNPAA